MDVVDYAIYLTTGKRNRAPDVTTNSRMKNILISNVIADGVGKMSGIQMMGLPEQPIQGVRLENIRLTSKGGGTEKDAASVPKELGDGYPEPGKIGTLPAYGVYARHIQNLELANLTVDFRTNDVRSAIVCSDVSGLEIDNFKAKLAAGVLAKKFENVDAAVIRNSPVLQ
jgi:hypothetical protein